MPEINSVTITITQLPNGRASVVAELPTPRPGMRLESAAHSLAIDALGWIGKQPAADGITYSDPVPAVLQVQRSTSCISTQKETRFLRLLRWSAEDLADPVIRADANRLEQERQTAVKRLAPHIEELVALAWAQLQAGNSSECSKESP